MTSVSQAKQQRDSQRNKFDRAIQAANKELELGTVDKYQIREFIRGVENRKFIKKNFTSLYVNISFIGKYVAVEGYRYKHWDKLQLLEVLTNVACKIKFKGDPDVTQMHRLDTHDAYFCYIYLKIVQNVLGKKAAEVVKKHFKAERVKHRKPRLDVTNPQGNALALQVHRLKTGIENAKKPVWELLGQ